MNSRERSPDKEKHARQICLRATKPTSGMREKRSPSNSESVSPALLLTPRQAAETLAISDRKLWSLKATGEIPSLKIGRLVRYSAADLQQWIDAQKKGAKTR